MAMYLTPHVLNTSYSVILESKYNRWIVGKKFILATLKILEQILHNILLELNLIFGL